MRLSSSDGEFEKHMGYKSVCFNCGNRASAVWQGSEGSVEVCGLCATEVLPKLIADAVIVTPTERGTLPFIRHLEAVGASYWYAVAARLAAENQRLQDKLDGKPEGPSVLTGDPDQLRDIELHQG